MWRYKALVFALVLPAAIAQTVTTTDALGETVIENLTVDLNGLPTTVILETLTGVAAAATTLTTTDAAGDTLIEVVATDADGDPVTRTIQTIPAAADPVGQGQGPVGQPGPTGVPGAPTPFTYTTTDADGATRKVVATFTPTFPGTVTPQQTFQATVLDYSAYTANYITAQAQAAANQNAASKRTPAWWAPCLTVLVGCVAGGAFLLGA
ncbi:hypothetical protein R3P38DRAFT_3039144 [Favolaschia claudopus]|uniref:Uncharacterized protein n=1 Tax=Favolaschia claudopus TaxID=2862362 RepID=A0AAW0A9D4_9AGAR